MADFTDPPKATIKINGHDVTFRVALVRTDPEDQSDSFVNTEATVGDETFSVGGGWLLTEAGATEEGWADGRDHDAGEFLPYGGYENGEVEELAGAVGLEWGDDQGTAMTRDRVFAAINRGSRAAWDAYRDAVK